MSIVSYDNFIYNGQLLEKIVSDGKYVWVCDTKNDNIKYIYMNNGSTGPNQIPNKFSTGSSIYSIASDGKYLWYTGTNADSGGNKPDSHSVIQIEINQIDLYLSNIISASEINKNVILVGYNNGAQPTEIVSNGTNVWVIINNENRVAQIDIATSTIIKYITVGNNPSAIALDTKYVWVANQSDNTVTQISIASGTVIRRITVGTNPRAISSDGMYVWVANYDSNTVSQIYIETGYVVNTIPVGTNPSSISSDGAYVWVANGDSNGISRIMIDGHSTGTRQGTNIIFALDMDTPDPLSVTSDGLYVWVTASNGKVYKITNPLGKYVNPAWYVIPSKPIVPNKYIEFGNGVSMNYNHTIPKVSRFMMKPLFANNAQTFYKPGSLASGGVGTVKNNRFKSKYT
jgi:YVTN family beta-propeller protein